MFIISKRKLAHIIFNSIIFREYYYTLAEVIANTKSIKLYHIPRLIRNF